MGNYPPNEKPTHRARDREPVTGRTRGCARPRALPRSGAVDDRHAHNVARDRRRVWGTLPTTMGWQPGPTAAGLAETLKLPLHDVSHHLFDLEDAGLALRAGDRWRRCGNWPDHLPPH